MITASALRISIPHILAHRAASEPGRSAYLYLADGESETLMLTYGELHEKALGIAREVAALGLRGERALLLFSSDIDFIAAFLGCLYAGVIAVPSAYPSRPRHLPRVRAIAADCMPAAILTESGSAARTRALVEQPDWPCPTRVLAADVMEPALNAEWDPCKRQPETAFLQYTSGSTSDPRGVIVTHDGLVHNQAMIQSAFAQTPEDIVAGWLPLFHDMGLIGTVLQPLYTGSRCILMPPAAFLQRPSRWLSMVSRYRATTSGGPISPGTSVPGECPTWISNPLT